MTKIYAGAFAELDPLGNCLQATNYHPTVKHFVDKLIWKYPHELGPQITELFEQVAKNLTLAFSPEKSDFPLTFTFFEPQAGSWIQSQMIADLIKLCYATGRFGPFTSRLSRNTTRILFEDGFWAQVPSRL